MVEAGNIEIGGTINVQGIETGLTRVESGLKDVGTTGKSVNADFVRMNQQAGRLGKTMGLLALTGAGAMISIAKNAPATAGAMASIGVSFMKLKFALGVALKPAFDWFADKLSWFANWASSNPDLFGVLTTSIGILAGAFVAFQIGGVIAKGVSLLLWTGSSLIALVSSPAFLAAVAALAAAAALWALVQGQATAAKETEAFYKAAGITHEEVVQSAIQGYQGTIYPGMSQSSYYGPGSVYDISNKINAGEYIVNRKTIYLSWDDKT